MGSSQATQSVRQAARKAAFAAQTRRRAEQAERDKRIDAGVVALVIALRERADAEHRAGAALQALLTEGVPLNDVAGYTDGELTARDARRLARTADGIGS